MPRSGMGTTGKEKTAITRKPQNKKAQQTEKQEINPAERYQNATLERPAEGLSPAISQSPLPALPERDQKLGVQDEETTKRLIEEEEEWLERNTKAMIKVALKLEDRDRTQGADLETSLTMQDQAEEDAAYLSSTIQNPYFGMMRLSLLGKERRVYVGKDAFDDLQGTTIVSWRSDVGAAFYSQGENWSSRNGKGGKVIHRRQVDIRKRKVIYAQDLTISGEEVQGARAEILHRRIQESRGGNLKEVVETMQPEQDALMRQPAGQALIVQGPAGSGKTTLLLHRAAYLSARERGEDRIPAEGIMILLPTGALVHAASGVLASLGSQGSWMTTPHQWATRILGQEKVQSSDRTLELLLSSKSRTQQLWAWRRAKLLGEVKMLSVMRKHLASRARQQLASARLAVDKDKLSLLLEQTLTTPQGWQGELQKELSTLDLSSSEKNKIVSQIFGSATSPTEASRLLSNLAELEATELLSEAELSILGTDMFPKGKPTRGSFIDASELGWALCAETVLRGLKPGLARPGAKRWDHILVDEAQDLSPLLVHLIALSAKSGQLTLVGDLDQGMHGYRGPSNWEQDLQALRLAWQGTEPSLSYLTQSWRSTRQIGEAARLAAGKMRVEGSRSGSREGSEIETVKVGTEEIPREAARLIQAARAAGHENIAVICRSAIQAERLPSALEEHGISAPLLLSGARYEGGAVTLDVSVAKGMEFAATITIAPLESENEYERRLRYVMLTRGLHWMACIQVQDNKEKETKPNQKAEDQTPEQNWTPTPENKNQNREKQGIRRPPPQKKT